MPGRPTHLRTGRLLLRHWLASDRLPFAALNTDPVVMEHFPAPLSAADSDAFVDRIEDHFERKGWGLWAVELQSTGSFIGYVGLWPATFAAHFTPAVEVGWRVSREHWGRGLAPEAGRAAVSDGFARLGVDEIVSFTATTNVRSQRVMEKLGMHRDGRDDFDHPAVPEGSPLRRHVLYRVRRTEWHDGHRTETRG